MLLESLLAINTVTVEHLIELAASRQKVRMVNDMFSTRAFQKDEARNW